MKEPSAAFILVLFFSIFVSPHRKRRRPPVQDYKVIIFGPGGGVSALPWRPYISSA